MTEQDIRHILWYAGHPEGYRPGSFTEALLHAWGKADFTDAERLRSAFPGLGQALNIFLNLGSEGLLAKLSEAAND